MRFGLNFGLLANSSSLYTNCFILDTDGTWYGYESGTFGSATPNTTSGGVLFYSFKYKATGEFEMHFGVAGNEQLPDITEIWAVNDEGTYSQVLVWDATAQAYLGTDVDAATYLITQTDICIGFYALPELMIHYDYNMEVI